jgi:hypothetical protein
MLLTEAMPRFAMAKGNTKPPDINEAITKLEKMKPKDDRGDYDSFFRLYPEPPMDISLRKKWYILSSRYANLLFSQTNLTREDGISVLGVPFDAPIIIEGMRAEEVKGGNRILAVDRINGEKLKKPILIWIENVKSPWLPKDKRCVLLGYETGRWIGGNDGQQFIWQFHQEFIITQVFEPATLQLEKM